jgi:hypothetical protein
MKRIALLALILALILSLILALVLAWPRRPATPETGQALSPLSMAISTPETPLPPPEETGLEVSTELSPLPLRVCAGNAVRWRNRDGPVILTASDASFSSGVLGPGEEYAVVFPAEGTVTVTVVSPAGETVMEPYRIEVVRCAEGELP